MRLQAFAYFVLVYALTCWLILLLSGGVLKLFNRAPHMAATSLLWLLPLSLLPVLVLGVIRRSRVRDVAQARWEETDRTDPASLLAYLLWARARRVALGEDAYHKRRVLARQAMLRLPLSALDVAAQRILFELLLDHRIRPSAEELQMGARLLATGELPVTRRLQLWESC